MVSYAIPSSSLDSSAMQTKNWDRSVFYCIFGTLKSTVLSLWVYDFRIFQRNRPHRGVHEHDRGVGPASEDTISTVN